MRIGVVQIQNLNICLAHIAWRSTNVYFTAVYICVRFIFSGHVAKIREKRFFFFFFCYTEVPIILFILSGFQLAKTTGDPCYNKVGCYHCEIEAACVPLDLVPFNVPDQHVCYLNCEYYAACMGIQFNYTTKICLRFGYSHECRRISYTTDEIYVYRKSCRTGNRGVWIKHQEEPTRNASWHYSRVLTFIFSVLLPFYTCTSLEMHSDFPTNFNL